MTQAMQKKQKGFTLMELMIVIVVGGLILALAAPKIEDMWTSFKVNQFADQVSSVVGAMNEKYGNKASYAGASMTELEKILPDAIGDGTGVNPWGGDIDVQVTGEPRVYKITGTKLAEKAGEKAILKFSNATYNSGTETVEITIGS